jgi:adenylate kinase
MTETMIADTQALIHRLVLAQVETGYQQYAPTAVIGHSAADVIALFERTFGVVVETRDPDRSNTDELFGVPLRYDDTQAPGTLRVTVAGGPDWARYI